MTTQSQDIIERLERASGPDRELDAAIQTNVVGIKMYERNEVY